MIEQNTKSIMGSVTNQLKKKKTNSKTCISVLLLQFIGITLFYVSLHPNTKIYFQTNFIGLLWQLCFSRVHL